MRFAPLSSEQRGAGTASEMADRLVGLVEPEGADAKAVPQALLHHLIRAYQMHDATAADRRELGEELNRAGEEQILWGPWMWRGYYALKRMAHRYRDARGEAIAGLAEELHEGHFRAIEWIGLAARWAALLVR